MFYFKWDNAKKEDYKLNLESEQFVDSLSELTSNVCNIDNCSNVDASLSSFISSIENICNPLFKKSNTKSFNKTKGDDFVFDQECKDKRKSFYHILNKFRKNK